MGVGPKIHHSLWFNYKDEEGLENLTQSSCLGLELELKLAALSPCSCTVGCCEAQRRR